MHKIALLLMARAKAAGHQIVYAEASEPTSDRWLRRLGFKPHKGALYIWTAEHVRT